MIGILSKPDCIPKLLNNPVVSRFLTNLDLLLPQTAQCDEIIILPLLSLQPSGIFLSVFFTFQTKQDFFRNTI